MALYAWIEDYHLLLKEKLRQQWPTSLRKERGGNFIISADTGPIIDRFAAYSAGLGWYGLNHSLFVPGRGSWIVLGEILTDIGQARSAAKLPVPGVPPLPQGLSHRGPHFIGAGLWPLHLLSNPNEGDGPLGAAPLDGRGPWGMRPLPRSLSPP